MCFFSFKKRKKKVANHFSGVSEHAGGWNRAAPSRPRQIKTAAAEKSKAETFPQHSSRKAFASGGGALRKRSISRGGDPVPPSSSDPLGHPLDQPLFWVVLVVQLLVGVWKQDQASSPKFSAELSPWLQPTHRPRTLEESRTVHQTPGLDTGEGLALHGPWWTIVLQDQPQ